MNKLTTPIITLSMLAGLIFVGRVADAQPCMETEFWPDADMDTWGDNCGGAGPCPYPECHMSNPGGWVTRGMDCDDGNPAINPDATEVCDGDDNDCDGNTDENAVTEVCNGQDDDCDGDTDEHASSETCNYIDDDCDGMVDEGQTVPLYRDLDNDGYGGSFWAPVMLCPGTPGYSPNNLDCADWDPNSNPGETEVCDWSDNDCDFAFDEGVQVTIFYDYDRDGYGVGSGFLGCDNYPWWATMGGDCNNYNANVNPSKKEQCNNVDDDCDSTVDEVPSPPWGWLNNPCFGTGYPYGVCRFGTNQCVSGVKTCVATYMPGELEEVCDCPPFALDNDCDGLTDENHMGMGIGDPCTVPMGVGVCEHGTVQCGCMGTFCDAPMPGEIGEFCNGDDDDCDGTTDELAEACGEGSVECVCGMGGCSCTEVEEASLCGAGCPAGTYCSTDGRCQDWCEGACGADQFCDRATNSCRQYGLTSETVNTGCSVATYGQTSPLRILVVVVVLLSLVTAARRR